jgi:ketosteroid isomerase-like protein
MKQKVPVVATAYILSVLVAGALFAQTTAQGSSSPSSVAGAQGRSEAEQQVEAAHEQLLQAAESNDKETIRRLIADDLTWVSVDGVVASKSQLLEGPMKPPRNAKMEGLWTFGNTAVVTGSVEVADGRQAKYIQEWVNRDGQWQLFSHQGTVVALPQPGQPPPTPAAVGTSGRMAMRSAAPTLNSEPERAVWKTQTALQRAFLKGDAALYSRLTADTLIRIGPDGQQDSKMQFLHTVSENVGRSGGRLETNDVQISVTGDTARLVMNIWGTLPGGQSLAPARMTRVFVKRGGEWVQTASIMTPIAQ